MKNRINLIDDNAVTNLYKSGWDVPSVVGSTAIAYQFAFERAIKRGIISFVEMNQRIYQLDKVNPIQFNSERLQLADINDFELVMDWVYEFCESIDDFVIIAKKDRPTKNGVVLSLVYTF